VAIGFRRETTGRVASGECLRAANLGAWASGEFGYDSVRNEGDLIDEI
jgi:hypothetical protein